jgi:hypothetical protein
LLSQHGILYARLPSRDAKVLSRQKRVIDNDFDRNSGLDDMNAARKTAMLPFATCVIFNLFANASKTKLFFTNLTYCFLLWKL